MQHLNARTVQYNYLILIRTKYLNLMEISQLINTVTCGNCTVYLHCGLQFSHIHHVYNLEPQAHSNTHTSTYTMGQS